jgi:hypothetical protein
VALDNPALANAVRVAGELLRWSAMVRNRPYYGDGPDKGGDGGSIINIHLGIERAETVINPE